MSSLTIFAPTGMAGIAARRQAPCRTCRHPACAYRKRSAPRCARERKSGSVDETYAGSSSWLVVAPSPDNQQLNIVADGPENQRLSKLRSRRAQSQNGIMSFGPHRAPAAATGNRARRGASAPAGAADRRDAVSRAVEFPSADGESNHLPRSFNMPSLRPISRWVGVAPRQTTKCGLLHLDGAQQKGRHIEVSCSVGVRLPGGRQNIVLVMKTDVPRSGDCRDRPMAASMRSSNWPERPTKGLPWISSSRPGASPISITWLVDCRRRSTDWWRSSSADRLEELERRGDVQRVCAWQRRAPRHHLACFRHPGEGRESFRRDEWRQAPRAHRRNRRSRRATG